MLRRGVGIVTGLRGLSVESAVVVDDRDVYESVVRAAGASISEFTSYPGVRVAIGGGLLRKPALVLVPPYPAALYEVVQELIVFGVRRIVAISKGYALRRSVPSSALLLPQAAVPLDSVSRAAVRPGVPLIVARSLYNMLSDNVIRKGGTGFSAYYRGKSVVTVDSPRLAAAHMAEDVEAYAKYKDVIAVDTLTAPLYAIQYHYPSLEAASLIYIVGGFEAASRLVEESIDKYQSAQYRLRRTLTLLVLSVVESLTGEEAE